MEYIKPYPVIKQGMLGKLGGGAGGHRNWKDRYFVFSDHLYYYASQQAYSKEPKNPIGRVVLNSYFCSKSEEAATTFEFTINAYPKSLTLKAGSVAEVDSWIAAIMSPLEELSRVPGPAGGPAAASDAVPATA